MLGLTRPQLAYRLKRRHEEGTAQEGEVAASESKVSTPL
jgi:hypothetical protein